MQCFNPILITLPKPRYNYATKTYEKRAYVPCGRCVACKERLRLSWFVRLVEENKFSTSSYFVTLTYSEEFVPCRYDEDLGKFVYFFDKEEIQKFLKRFRKYDASNKVRYFLVCEYGGKHYRPHYHLHIFNAVGSQEQVAANIARAWPYGRISCAQSNDARFNYVAGHVQMRDDVPAGYARPFALMSRKPGIGFQGITNIMKSIRKGDTFRLYRTEQGMKLSLPRYYQQLIFTRRQNDIRNYRLQCYIDSISSDKDDLYRRRAEFVRKVNERKKLKILNNDI